MLRIWATVTTVVNTALAVAGVGIAGYAAAAKPGFVFFYYGVALICIVGAAVGFVNLYFLNEAVRRSEEKNRPAREERERRKAEKAARKAEKEAARAEKEAAKEAAAREAAERTAQEQPAAPLMPEEPELLEEDPPEGEASTSDSQL